MLLASQGHPRMQHTLHSLLVRSKTLPLAVLLLWTSVKRRGRPKKPFKILKFQLYGCASQHFSSHFCSFFILILLSDRPHNSFRCWLIYLLFHAGNAESSSPIQEAHEAAKYAQTESFPQVHTFNLAFCSQRRTHCLAVSLCAVMPRNISLGLVLHRA